MALKDLHNLSLILAGNGRIFATRKFGIDCRENTNNIMLKPEKNYKLHTNTSQMASSTHSRPHSMLNDSKGLLPKPPQSVQHKYTFTKPGFESSSCCGCFSFLGETWTEIYVSPNEIVSREQLLMHARPSICASKEKMK